MRIYEIPDHPLRLYIDSEGVEVQKLILSLDTKYSPEVDDAYPHPEDEMTSLILYDEYLQQHYFIRGLLNIIVKECEMIGISVSVDVTQISQDLEYPEISEDILTGITLRSYQSEGISSCLAHKSGIVQVHTGGGKTEMMIGVSRYLLDHRDGNILICVPTTNLLYQTQERMISRGISESDISLLGDGNHIEDPKRIIVSTVASAYTRLGVNKDQSSWVDNLICMMMDEAHHSKCRTWSTLIDRLAPEYLLGFSAEPFHRDKDHMISDLVLRGLFGPVIHRVTMDYLVAHGFLSKPYVIAIDTRFNGNMYNVLNWQTVNKSCIVENKSRNEDIVQAASILINDDKRPLILVQQIAHGHTIAKQLSELGYSVYMMTGGRKISVFSGGINTENYVDNDNVVLKDFDAGKIDALIGTSTLDEGADIPTLSSVILAGGGKGRLKTVQKVGRSMRQKIGLNCTFVLDFRDRFNVVTHSHFKKRKTLYDELNMGVYYLDKVEGLYSMIKSLEDFRRQELENQGNLK